MSQYGNIGQLNIEINANAELATKGLDQLANTMKNLTFGNVSGLKDFTKDLKALAKVNFSGNNIGNSLSNLQAQITGLNFETLGLTSLVNDIKKLGSKSVDNAINKMPMLADAMTILFNRLSTAPMIRQDVIDMTKALADFTANGGKVGSASRKIASGMDRMGKSAKKNKGLIAQFFAGFNAGNFAGNFTANLVAPAIRSIFGGISEAMRGSMEYASSLVETQNVLERTFGNSIDVVEDFSKTALKMYGMNELESKKMIGTFQAMGTALGETKERMADVSTSMGALVGDYASFFNMNVADVANDFTAIFTGQTKAMRKYGIDLTNAQLQDFANSQGWDVQVKSLNQYNKAIIRYNYLVSRSQDILGDFQRTQGSYANQVKLLSQQYKELFGTLGQIGTAVLTPILQVLNEIISKIRQFAEQLVAFLGIDNFASISGGAVEGLEDIADGFDDVAEAEKKAKTYSTGIDELNVLKPNESASKGNGAGELGAGWDTDWWDKLEKGKKDFIDFSELIQNIYNTIKPTIDAFKEFYSNVLEPLGKVAFDGLTSLYEDFLKPIAKYSFGEALPFLFNTLADIGKKIDWKTISSGLKNIIQVLGKATTGIGRGLLDFFKSIAPILKPVIATTINLIAKAFELLAKALNKIPVKVFELIGRGLGIILTYKAINGMVTNLGKAFSNLGNSLMAGAWQSKTLEAFPKIRDAIFGAGSALDKFGLAIQGISSTIAIISAIAMAIYQLYDYCKKLEEERFDNFLSGYGTSLSRLEEVKTKIEEVNQAGKDLLKGGGEVGQQASYIENLATKYFELAEKTNLTNDEQKQLVFWAGQLVDAVPELANNIDTVTGRYKGTKEEIQKVIDKTIELAKAEAIKEWAKEVEKANIEATAEIEKLNKAMADTQAKRDELQKKLDSGWNTGKEQMFLADAQTELDKYDKMLGDIQEKIKGFQDTINDNNNMEQQMILSMNVEVNQETVDTQISQANEEIKNKVESVPKEDKAKIEVGAKVSEEDINKIPEETKTKVATTNEELAQDENKLKVGVKLDSTGLDTGLDTMKESIETKGEEITGSMTNVGTNAVNALNTTMLNGNATYIETLTENATVIKTTFEDAKIGLGIKGNTSTVFEEYGLAVVNGFKAGIEKNKQISINAVSVWVKDIMRTFVGNDVEGINYNVWFEYAHQVMLGFAEGITYWSYLAMEAIRQWVAEMMAEFESDMEIESPSKVFADYGYYTVAGFNKGIEDNQSTTTTIIKDWVGDIEKQMQAIENFNIDMSNTIKGLDNLTAKVNTQVDMSGFYGELEKASTMGMTTSLNNYAENRQAIEVNIPNITLELDSREIARANYKGQRELGYQIRK